MPNSLLMLHARIKQQAVTCDKCGVNSPKSNVQGPKSQNGRWAGDNFGHWTLGFGQIFDFGLWTLDFRLIG
jgi:hypothetical protein